jgi:HSP20 family protein
VASRRLEVTKANRSQGELNHERIAEMNTATEQETRTNTPGQESAPNYVAPDVNIHETKNGYVLQAEMPGVSRTGLDISVDGNQLTIIGRRAPADLKAGLLHRESSGADYRRVFELDPAIDAAKIDAKVDQGVLTIHLLKSERVKPRKVTVSD